MLKVKSTKLPELAVPAFSVAVLLACVYWILDIALTLGTPDSQALLSSLLSAQPVSQKFLDSVTVRRIVSSALIGLAGAAAFIIAFRGWRPSARWDIPLPVTRLDTRFRALLDSTFDSILLVSQDGRVCAANAAACRVFGGSADAFPGLSASTFFTPSGTAERRVAQDGVSKFGFDRALCRDTTRVTALGLDGRSFPADIRASQVDIDGTQHFILCIKDLTAEIEARQATRHSESRYTSLFNNLLDGVYQSTVDGEILSANPAMVRLLGYSSPDELRTSVRMPELYRNPRKCQQVLRLLSRTHTVRNFETELVRKDGTFVSVHTNIRAIHGDAEYGTIYEGTVSDVSNIAAARSALQRSEELFRAITEHSLDIVAVLDPRGHTVYVSPSGDALLGFQTGGAIGRNVFSAIHRDDQAAVREVLDKAFANPRSPHRFTFRLLRRDGRTAFLESVGSAYRTHDGNLRAVIHSRDVTERKQTEAQLQQAQKMQAVVHLTGSIAHDFNNLLTVIVGNLQLLEEQLQDRDESRQVQNALRASMQGSTLIRRLLAFSRRQFLEPKVIIVNELLEAMVPIIRRSLNESTRFDSRLAPGVWPTKIDSTQLENALLHVIVNAADAMRHDGELTISTWNCVLAESDLPADSAGNGGDYVCITVTDTGCGMSDEVARRAIEPFFSTKNKNDGAGLGLSMVYGFVRQSGGHMRIESAVNRGTTVQIFLPSTTQADRDFTDADLIPDAMPRTEAIVADSNRDAGNLAAGRLRHPEHLGKFNVLAEPCARNELASPIRNQQGD